MKIIDLLNKIANGEEVPERINWGCHSYEWKDYEYKALDELGTPLFSEQAGYTEHCLNDEVAVCSTELSLKEATEKFYKISEGLANKKIEEEKKIPEKLEDISEIKCVGCEVEINIAGNKMLFSTDTPIVTEHCIYKINQLIKNQKKIIDYLKSKGE